MLANALGPSISQARAAGRTHAGEWTEVCTSTGTRWLRLDVAGQVLEESRTRPAEGPAQTHYAACAFCLPHAGSVALLPPDLPSAWTAIAASSEDCPVPALAAAAATPVWSWPALRGPPRG